MKYRLTLTYSTGSSVVAKKEFKGRYHLRRARAWKFNCVQIAGNNPDLGTLEHTVLETMPEEETSALKKTDAPTPIPPESAGS